MCGGVADDSSLTDVFAASLKLRLDQNDCFERSSLPDGGNHGRQDQGCRDEGNIHCEKGNARRQLTGSELAGIGALHERDARIATQAVGDLTVSCVDGQNIGCSVLEHAVGKASGGRANIQTELSRQIDFPALQRGFELEAATADVGIVVPEQAHGGGLGNSVAGLFNLLLIDENPAGENERLGPLTAGHEPAFDKQFVEADFHCNNFAPRPTPTRLAASYLYDSRYAGIGYIGINRMPDGQPNPNAPGTRFIDRTTGGTSMSDDALLSAIRSNSQEAMTALFDRYSKLVYSVALRVLSDSSEAEDVMQETFIQVWKNPGAFVPGRGSLGGWLVVVARNRAIDKLRRRRPTEPVELFTLPSSTNLERESEHGVLLEKIQTAMAELPDEQRSVVDLAFFEGLSHSEIAEKTGTPLGTVKTRIRLALIGIRKGLKV